MKSLHTAGLEFCFPYKFTAVISFLQKLLLLTQLLKIVRKQEVAVSPTATNTASQTVRGRRSATKAVFCEITYLNEHPSQGTQGIGCRNPGVTYLHTFKLCFKQPRTSGRRVLLYFSLIGLKQTHLILVEPNSHPQERHQLTFKHSPEGDLLHIVFL